MQISPQKTMLKKQMLDVLSIPHCQAPSEAEAECARLQSEGIVDAVWSEDSDILMFGSTFIIRNYRDPNGPKHKNGKLKRSSTHVRVHRAEVIKRELGLDKKDFLLAAILAGNDYDDHKGLKNCGLKTALEAARAGCSHALWEGGTSIMNWRAQMSQFFEQKWMKFELPSPFPDLNVFRHCRRPRTSEAPELARFRREVKFDRAIDEAALLLFMGPTFNLWAEQYLRLITPILLVRKLASTKPGREDSNSGYSVEVIPWGKTKNFVASTARVGFVPRHLTKIDLSYNRKVGLVSDSDEPQKCITLAFLLKKGLGELFTETTSKPAKKMAKRRPTEAEPDLDQPTNKRARLPKATPNKTILPPTPITLLSRQGPVMKLQPLSHQRPVASASYEEDLFNFSSSPPSQSKWDDRSPSVRRDQASAMIPTAPASDRVNEMRSRQAAQVFSMPNFDVFDIDDFWSQDPPQYTSLSPNRENGKSMRTRPESSTKPPRPLTEPKRLDRAEIAEMRIKHFGDRAESSALTSTTSTARRELAQSGGMNLISSQTAGQIFDLTGD
jgi:hypothetical protein